MYKSFAFAIAFSMVNVASTSLFAQAPCSDVTVESANNLLTVDNLDAPHSHVDIYRTDEFGKLVKFFGCNDDCNHQVNVNVKSGKKYMIHVKLFDKDWKPICDQQIQHTASGEAKPEPTPSADAVTVEATATGLAIGKVKAPHAHVDVYKIGADGSWNKVFSCNDNCKRNFEVTTDPQAKHIVHVKLFYKNWKLGSEKKIEYNPH